jgi:hypothetical protein
MSDEEYESEGGDRPDLEKKWHETYNYTIWNLYLDIYTIRWTTLKS